MASSYTNSELIGAGSLLKENFEQDTTYTLTITNTNLTGSSYLAFETKLHDSSLPGYLSGSTFVGDNVGAVSEYYHAAMNIHRNGDSTIVWTPKIDVDGDNVYIKSTGGFDVSIAGDLVSPILHYYDPSTSYSGTGTVLTDLVGNGNATIVGAPPYTSGVGGYFTMSNDRIDSPNLNGTITAVAEAHSVEVWIYPTANGVIASYQGNTYNTGYHFSAIELVAGQVEFGLWNGTSIASTGGTGALTLNAWHQIVLTFNGTGLQGYVDGAAAGSPIAVSWDSPMNDSDPSFYIAFGAADFTDQGDGSYFDGRMGVQRIYNKALSSAEVLQNWNATKGQYGL